ncbi:MAG: chemotaxis protein CheX [Acidobacteria bacterium]|nr:chemotaxis protein CheX [Acidobacteriota bacterium]MBI3426971.1 chemotaxis protein CheX [Acidobacteriota bacterium]
MQFLENEIRQVTEMVWASMLERELEPGHYLDWQPVPVEMLMGSVHLHGDWNGAVTLNCSVTLARQLAAILFGVPEQSTTLEQTQDVLGELANIVGGNIKGLLPLPSQLSLPSVKAGADYLSLLPDGQVVSKVEFQCLGEPLFVVLLKNEAQQAA